MQWKNWLVLWVCFLFIGAFFFTCDDAELLQTIKYLNRPQQKITNVQVVSINRLEVSISFDVAQDSFATEDITVIDSAGERVEVLSIHFDDLKPNLVILETDFLKPEMRYNITITNIHSTNTQSTPPGGLSFEFITTGFPDNDPPSLLSYCILSTTDVCVEYDSGWSGPNPDIFDPFTGFSLTFDEPMEPATVQFYLSLMNGEEEIPLKDGVWSNFKQNVVFEPQNEMAGMTVTLSLTNEAKDARGNGLINPLDGIEFIITGGSLPTNGSWTPSGTIAAGPNITTTFTLPMNASTVEDIGNYSIDPANPNISITSVSYNEGSRLATITIAYNNTDGTETYTVTPSVNILDNEGNPLSPRESSIYTAADAIPPSGYIVSIDQVVINSTNETGMSFTFSGAEVGSTYDYSITSSGGGTAVSDSGTITIANQQITGIDVSGLEDGTLTLSVYLTDTYDNQGATEEGTIIKDTMTTQRAKTTAVAADDSRFSSVIASSNNYVYAAGYIYDTAEYNFGNGKTAQGAYSSENILLVKYDNTGVAQWAKSIVMGLSASAFKSVGINSDGSSIYALGYIQGLNLFEFGDGVNITGNHFGWNPVLIKYTYNGNAVWGWTVEVQPNFCNLYAVSVSSDDNIYAAGEMVGTTEFDFGNGVRVTGAYSQFNVILLKFHSSGTPLWANTIVSGSADCKYKSVAVSGDGSSIYAAGTIEGSGMFQFDNGVTVSGDYSGENILLIKYNDSGTPQWARSVDSGPSESAFKSVSVSSDDSIYAVGTISGISEYNFGNGVTASGKYNGNNILLVKYSSNGTPQWAKTVATGPNDSGFNSISISNDGNSVYGAGFIRGNSVFSFGYNVSATGDYSDLNLLIVKYNSVGTPLWAKTVDSGLSTSSLFAISASGVSDDIYACGFINGNSEFNFGNSVTATGAFNGENILLLQYQD